MCSLAFLKCPDALPPLYPCPHPSLTHPGHHWQPRHHHQVLGPTQGLHPEHPDLPQEERARPGSPPARVRLCQRGSRQHQEIQAANGERGGQLCGADNRVQGWGRGACNRERRGDMQQCFEVHHVVPRQVYSSHTCRRQPLPVCNWGTVYCCLPLDSVAHTFPCLLSS